MKILRLIKISYKNSMSSITQILLVVTLISVLFLKDIVIVYLYYVTRANPVKRVVPSDSHDEYIKN